MVVLMAVNTRLIVLGGVLGGLLVGPAIARHAAAPLQAVAATEQANTRKTIDIVAERFLFMPSEVTVDSGTTLEIRLTSEDTDHGFRIIGTDVNVTIPKRGRGEVIVVFEPKEDGDYTFECSQICGAGHSFMRGRIRVEPAGVASDGARP